MSGFGVQPADIVNRALDVIGHSQTIGDLEEGTMEARVALRNYAPSVMEISRAAHWNFARRQAQLTLLQDASGQTAGVGTGTPGMGQWLYEYAWPGDCLKARYVPWQGNLTTPVPSGNLTPPASSAPLFPGGVAFPINATIPAPFLVSQDIVANLSGVPDTWAGMPDLTNQIGQGYSQQTVILTDVPNATLVYTSLVQEPNIWDPLFQQAIVALLAAKFAMPILSDKKFALQMRGLAIKMAKDALEAARLADGNEGPTNVNRDASWITTRGVNYGGWNGYSNPGGGILWGGWSACPFPDGSAY